MRPGGRISAASARARERTTRDAAKWRISSPFSEFSKSEKPVLAGFSFGAAVQTKLAQRLVKEGNAPSRMALVGLAVKHLDAMPVPADTIVIHGEEDSTVLLADVLAWARPQDLPVVVVPGADHFFHRRLHILRSIIQGSWK